jgi:DNA-binding response OmpR family regulator
MGKTPDSAHRSFQLNFRIMIDNKIPQAGKPCGTLLHYTMNSLHRVLVVEDEPDIRRLNAEVLESYGYQVDTAEDGEAGWEALHATRHAPESYALLITDHEMPGLSGLALVKKLRAARMALPVIMATGTMPTKDLFTRYPWLQPAATLVKPYSIEQLLGTVEKVLRVTASPREEIVPAPKWLSNGGMQLHRSPTGLKVAV